MVGAPAAPAPRPWPTSCGCSFEHMVDAFGYGPEVFEEFRVAAVESAFLPLPKRRRLIDQVIRLGYGALRADGRGRAARRTTRGRVGAGSRRLNPAVQPPVCV
ncbi:hypothetical protein SAVERM_641 [Streptomyces avermitilis MA-4680 = NBRC 14893]|uniref:Uncharacterized protein n=2 Tax=Streptomyces avermitilis TaxID=33903 RepID=Q82Q80_STRAW|nr:hypothetical protein SAVERM_641 [Streptomyces avermitilis MA-4680 = NBRC 14893]